MSSSPTLDRRLLLPALYPKPDRHLFVSGLAGSGKDASALTDEADNLFAFGGAMGGAVPMALGLALSAPGDRVEVITGDGELLMNIGALATVASMMPENLSIVCIDNAMHGETGGQPGHTAKRTNLAVMADGAGIPSVMTVDAEAGLEAARNFIADAQGPRFLWARVTDGPPSAFKRNWDLAERRHQFRTAYLAKRNG